MWTIFGAGELIWDIIDAIESKNGIVTQIVLNQPINIINLHPYKVITLEQYLASKKSSYEHRIFGFIDPHKQKFLDQLNIFPEDFANVMHQRAWVCPLKCHGNYFGANSTVAAKVTMENFNYINRNASIGHHTKLGSYNHVGPGATICGKCSIGNSNFFGAGCIIKDGIVIKDNIVVGAGALVTKDLVESGVYIGSPATLFNPNPGGLVAKFYAQ